MKKRNLLTIAALSLFFQGGMTVSAELYDDVDQEVTIYVGETDSVFAFNDDMSEDVYVYINDDFIQNGFGTGTIDHIGGILTNYSRDAENITLTATGSVSGITFGDTKSPSWTKELSAEGISITSVDENIDFQLTKEAVLSATDISEYNKKTLPLLN